MATPCCRFLNRFWPWAAPLWSSSPFSTQSARWWRRGWVVCAALNFCLLCFPVFCFGANVGATRHSTLWLVLCVCFDAGWLFNGGQTLGPGPFERVAGGIQDRWFLVCPPLSLCTPGRMMHSRRACRVSELQTNAHVHAHFCVPCLVCEARQTWRDPQYLFDRQDLSCGSALND